MRGRRSQTGLDDQLRELAALVRRGGVVVMTGAGISLPAGITTLRGIGSASGPSSLLAIERAEPTLAHRAIKALVDRGYVDRVMTTNVDDLHKKSGVPAEKIIEFHGNIFVERCGCCGATYKRETSVSPITPAELMAGGVKLPPTGRRCVTCRGPLLPTVLPMYHCLDSDVIEEATEALRTSRLALVIGTSMVVQPAASLPFVAPAVAIVNPAATPFENNIRCNLVIREEADKVMSALLNLI